MWDTYNEDKASRLGISRIARLILFATISVVIISVAANQSVNLFMNIVEFGDVFTKSLYYSTISGIILASIVFVRINFHNRSSMTWYCIQRIIKFFNRRHDYESLASTVVRYPHFKMEKLNFIIWQITKVVLFAPLFSNLIFGMSIVYLFEGNDLNLESIPKIFMLPFVNIPQSSDFARDNVMPLVPGLTLIIPPLLSAMGLRIFFYAYIAGSLSIVSQYLADSKESRPKLLSYISSVEVIIGSGLLWTAFTMFFSSNINYNTKYAILGVLVIGIIFISYGLFDKRTAKIIVYPQKKQIYVRLLTLLLVSVIFVLIMAVNNSIADAKKIEYMGPYVAQEIAVNQVMADLDKVEIVNYDIKPPSITPSQIQSFVNDNKDTLNNIRLWDQQAAEYKLKPELGQKNDINFADTDIVRFNNSIYWAASTTPNLPADVTPENRWYNEHLVYTHATKGILMLEAATGNVIDSAKYFKQKNIYYGKSGLTGIFDKAWSAFTVGRTDSDEINNFFYNGTGGIDVYSPLSWIYEPNFMLSYPWSAIHVMRYKDIHQRMELMYPYFVYEFGFGTSDNNFNIKKIDAIPVTDGKGTYWLMPLIVLLDTTHVPWSSGNMLKLVGYAVIDAYNGSVQLIVNGKDHFSQMFFEQYKDDNIVKEIPEWLNKQIRYPKEMFVWRIGKFNQYHVTDPKTYIEAKNFYNIPEDAPAYYIITKPPGFKNLEFVGFQSLELRNPLAKNLVGYMIVQNNPENIGKMTFYSVPIDSNTKLLGPTAARETLEKDPMYAKEKTLLRNPRVGDSILYRIGNQEVYFIPIYTPGSAGGVVTQLGTIATVGASVTGNFYVGFGNTPKQSFENYLLKASGLPSTEQGNQTVHNIPDRLEKLRHIFSNAGLSLAKPTSVSAPLTFKEAETRYIFDSDFANTERIVSKFLKDFGSWSDGRIFEWESDGDNKNNNKIINYGIMKEINGIVESHYISIEVG